MMKNLERAQILKFALSLFFVLIVVGCEKDQSQIFTETKNERHLIISNGENGVQQCITAKVSEIVNRFGVVISRRLVCNKTNCLGPGDKGRPCVKVTKLGQVRTLPDGTKVREKREYCACETSDPEPSDCHIVLLTRHIWPPDPKTGEVVVSSEVLCAGGCPDFQECTKTVESQTENQNFVFCNCFSR